MSQYWALGKCCFHCHLNWRLTNLQNSYNLDLFLDLKVLRFFVGNWFTLTADETEESCDDDSRA